MFHLTLAHTKKRDRATQSPFYAPLGDVLPHVLAPPAATAGPAAELREDARSPASFWYEPTPSVVSPATAGDSMSSTAGSCTGVCGCDKLLSQIKFHPLWPDLRSCTSNLEKETHTHTHVLAAVALRHADLLVARLARGKAHATAQRHVGDVDWWLSVHLCKVRLQHHKKAHR